MHEALGLRTLKKLLGLTEDFKGGVSLSGWFGLELDPPSSVLLLGFHPIALHRVHYVASDARLVVLPHHSSIEAPLTAKLFSFGEEKWSWAMTKLAKDRPYAPFGFFVCWSC